MDSSVTRLTAPTSSRSPRIRHTIMRTLCALFGLLLLAFLLVADGSNRINRLSDRALDGIYPMMRGAQSLVVTFRLLADQLAAAASLSDKAQLDVTKQTASRFREQIDELRACSSSPGETADLAEIRVLFDCYYEEGTQVAKAMIQGNDMESPDGLDTLRAILDLRPGQPCIIASGFSETDRAKEAASLGAGAFVSKPYSRDEIGRVVQQELARARTLAAASGLPSSGTSTSGVR